MYELLSAGFDNYEISNFAKPGNECIHNLAYWEIKPYIGLGPAAVSTVPVNGEAVRISHGKIGEYIEGAKNRWSMERETINPGDFLFEHLVGSDLKDFH